MCGVFLSSFAFKAHGQKDDMYGSLYVTLCFVLCPFDFGVLTIEFSVLCTMLHILNGALHVVEQRWRTNEERKTRV